MSKNRFLATAVLSWFAAGALAQAPDYTKVEYRNEKLTDNLFVLFGGGGNIAVLTGPDGSLVVDSDVPEMSAKMRAAVSLVSDRPARFLVNTHYHFDHAGGNPTLGRGNVVIVAQENVRQRLSGKQTLKQDGIDLTFDPTPREGLPLVTFEDGLQFHVNGEDVSVVHVAHAHTDGDAFVFFEKANVLHTGDLMMSVGYPIVDAGNGGSLDGLIAGHERIIKLCNDKTRVIPGHGPVVGKADLQAYHDMLVTIRQRVADLMRQGRSVEEVVSAHPSREFDERWGKGFYKPDLFVQRVFIELGRVKAQGKGKG
jgi:glyoxylase-like metal-dependent hydrolase (beta-lactamase superfamily II)